MPDDAGAAGVDDHLNSLDYIGVDGGYLCDFSYRSHAEFYGLLWVAN